MENKDQVEVTKPDEVEVVNEEAAVEEAVVEKVEPTMHTLGLNESLNTPLYMITRVPGGWAYHFRGGAAASQGRAGFFVPYSEEFKEATA